MVSSGNCLSAVVRDREGVGDLQPQPHEDYHPGHLGEIPGRPWGLAWTPQQDGASRAGVVLIQSEASSFSLSHLRALGLLSRFSLGLQRDRCGGHGPLWTVDQQKWKEGDQGFCSSLGKMLEGA